MKVISELTEDLDSEIDYCLRAIGFLECRTDNEPEKYPEQDITQYERRLIIAEDQKRERLKFIFGS